MAWHARWGWAAAPVFFLTLFFLIPLGAFLAYGLGTHGGTPSALIQGILGSPYHRERILFTLVLATSSAALTLLVGVPAAYLVARHAFLGRAFLRGLLLVPFVLPALVVALSFQALLGPLGAEGAKAFWILLGAHVFYNVGLVVHIVGGFWERVPQSLLDAARTLGASRLRSALRILLPLGLPAIVAAAALVFLFSASSFSLVLLLGQGRLGTIETLIYEEAVSIRPQYGVAAMLGLLQLAFTFLALGLHSAFQRRSLSRFPPQATAPVERLPAWGRPYLAAMALFIVAPLAALASAALRFGGGWSLEPIRILVEGRHAAGSYALTDVLQNSLLFGAGTVLVAVPLAYMIARSQWGLSARWAALEGFLLAPLGASAVLVAIGFLLAFDGAPLWDLRASGGRIVLGHVLIAAPFASRLLLPTMEALDRNLLDAARTLGARPATRFFRIELPLMRSGIVAASAVAFAASLGEFGATLVLRRPEFTTIPLAIFDAYSRPGAPFRAQAEVLSLALVIVALLAFWTLQRAQRQGGRLL